MPARPGPHAWMNSIASATPYTPALCRAISNRVASMSIAMTCTAHAAWLGLVRLGSVWFGLARLSSVRYLHNVLFGIIPMLWRRTHGKPMPIHATPRRCHAVTMRNVATPCHATPCYRKRKPLQYALSCCAAIVSPMCQAAKCEPHCASAAHATAKLHQSAKHIPLYAVPHVARFQSHVVLPSARACALAMRTGSRSRRRPQMRR